MDTTMKTDTQLQQDVIAELAWEPSVNAAQIGVEVKDGVVTLAGHVGSFVEKWEAERAAQRVSGIKGLAVEMDVTIPGSSKRNDVDIARSADDLSAPRRNQGRGRIGVDHADRRGGVGGSISGKPPRSPFEA
jgi:hypothetical protein